MCLSVYFLKVSSCFKLIYFWISRQNSSMEVDEFGIFSKAPDWKPLLLLTIKIKQKPGWPNREYNAIFEHSHQNIRGYHGSKKVCIDQWLWKYCCIFRRVRAKRGVGEEVWFVPNTLGVLRVWATEKKLGYFYFHLSLEAASPVLKLTQNCYINKNISFSWKLVI